MWSLKKEHNELLCRTDIASQTLKNIWFPKETIQGVGYVLGLWDRNPIKLDCDDYRTTINVKKLWSNKKKLFKTCSLLIFLKGKDVICTNPPGIC